MICYALGNNGEALVLTDSALDHFERHRQRRFYQREAGGQLFAHFVGANAILEVATGPRNADWRARFSYLAHRPSEQFEIAAFFNQGLHYIGDWHTHPEDRPLPSCRDVQTIVDIAHKSNHVLKGLVLLIVGRSAFPEGLFAGLTQASGLSQLHVVEYNDG